MTDKEKISSRINDLTVWKRGDQRAPHKPLLLLYALGRTLRDNIRLIPYADIDRDLKKLLAEFGPPRRSFRPEYPFWRMQTDGIWEVTNKDIPDLLSSSSDAKKSKLLEHNVQGGLPKDIYQLFNTDKQFFADVVTNILQTNFPASIHEDILQAVGIDLEDTAQKRVRDPYFRERVLRAYEYQCAVCGFNVRVGDSLVALEAAHIKWHQAGGPDLEKNGIALCSMHHKLFDRGAFTINEELLIQVSDNAHGSHGFNEWLMAFHGNNVREPQRGEYYPEPNFVKWHVKEVFRGYCREINGDAT